MAVFLSYWHHFIFLLLVSCLEVISSLVVSSTEDCIPRCCAQGQILDHTGTRCLRDLSREYIPDPCGRRDSFLPTCENQDGNEEGYVTHLYTLLDFELTEIQEISNNYINTVWKLQAFSITQILRENEIGECRSAKCAIFIHLEAMNFDFYEILHFYKIQSVKSE